MAELKLLKNRLRNTARLHIRVNNVGYVPPWDVFSEPPPFVTVYYSSLLGPT